MNLLAYYILNLKLMYGSKNSELKITLLLINIIVNPERQQPSITLCAYSLADKRLFFFFFFNAVMQISMATTAKTMVI